MTYLINMANFLSENTGDLSQILLMVYLQRDV